VYYHTEFTACPTLHNSLNVPAVLIAQLGCVIYDCAQQMIISINQTINQLITFTN